MFEVTFERLRRDDVCVTTGTSSDETDEERVRRARGATSSVSESLLRGVLILRRVVLADDGVGGTYRDRSDTPVDGVGATSETGSASGLGCGRETLESGSALASGVGGAGSEATPEERTGATLESESASEGAGAAIEDGAEAWELFIPPGVVVCLLFLPDLVLVTEGGASTSEF